ncbi:MAG: hypothetical protein ACREAA_18665 [Candidatus Polarisedimenticolia bacterium]
MPVRRTTALIVTALALVTLSSPAHAVLRSAKGPLVKHQVARVSLKNGTIAVRSYQFVRPTRAMKVNPFTAGGPYLEVEVANEGQDKMDFALVVALFDREGRLVGAGTGDHTGKLDAGQVKNVKVVFKDVNQDAHLATKIQMSLELVDLGSRADDDEAARAAAD